MACISAWFLTLCGLVAMWLRGTGGDCQSGTQSVFEVQAEIQPRDSGKPTKDEISAGYNKTVSLKVLIRNAALVSSSRQTLVIDQLYDQTTGSNASLFTPLLLVLNFEPVIALQPFKPVGVVNSQPYEEIIYLPKADPEWEHDCSSPTSLEDACDQDSYDYDTNLGYCCSCGKNQPWQHLPVCQSPGLIAARCFRHAPVRYTVNEVEPPQLYHEVTATVYLGETGEEKNQRTWVPFAGPLLTTMILPGEANQDKKAMEFSLTGEYTAVSFDNPKVLNFTNVKLLEPNFDEISEDLNEGISRFNMDWFPKVEVEEEFLVVPNNMIDLSGDTCGKVGVALSGFLSQDDRCRQQLQSCFSNQPLLLWRKDKVKDRNGQVGNHFLKWFGKLGTPDAVIEQKKSPSEVLRAIVFEFNQTLTSYLKLSMNLSSVVIANSGAHAELVSVLVQPFKDETSSLTVHIVNNGYVADQYSLYLSDCDPPVLVVDVISFKKVGPHQSVMFKIEVKPFEIGDSSGDLAKCLVTVIDSKQQSLASRQVFFLPQRRCVCMAHCRCKCGKRTIKCDNVLPVEYEKEGHASSIPEPPYESEKWTVWHIIQLMLAILLSSCLLGLIKSLMGLCAPRVGLAGLSSFNDPYFYEYYEPELKPYKVVYDEDFVPIHPKTKGRVRQIGYMKEVLLNSLFLFLITHACGVAILECCFGLLTRRMDKVQTKKKYEEKSNEGKKNKKRDSQVKQQ